MNSNISNLGSFSNKFIFEIFFVSKYYFAILAMHKPRSRNCTKKIKGFTI